MTNVRGLSLDRYGFLYYALVIMAPEDVQKAVDAIRRQLAIPVPLIPAHVTALGSFASIPSLEELKSRISSIAQEIGPFAIPLKEVEAFSRITGAAVKIEKSPEFQALHDKLWDAIRPITEDRYGDDKGDRFWPHLTLFQEVSPEDHRRGLQLTKGLKLPSQFTARDVHFMGLAGQRQIGKGEWRVVETFPLKAAASR